MIPDEDYLTLERDSSILEVAIQAVKLVHDTSVGGYKEKQKLLDSLSQAKWNIDKKQRVIVMAKD